MKLLGAKLFIVLTILGGIPNLVWANPNYKLVANAEIESTGYGIFRLPALSNQTHRVFLNRGNALVSINGDGKTDLDLYIYDSNGMVAKSESDYDNEAISLNIYRSGYFIVKVVNNGKVFNDYALNVE